RCPPPMSPPPSARALLAAAFVACAPLAVSSPSAAPRPNLVATAPPADPFAEHEAFARAPVDVPAPSHASPTLIRHATILTAAGKRYEPGFVLLKYGSIAAVGPGDGPSPAEDTVVVDAQGQFV